MAFGLAVLNTCMTWYIYIIMIGLYADGTQDTYLYTQPTHESLEACQQYVQEYASVLRSDMFNEFSGKSIERVFCIEEERLRQFLTISQGDSV